MADPLAESTFTGRIGEVQASPTSNTVLARFGVRGGRLGYRRQPDPASPSRLALLGVG